MKPPQEINLDSLVISTGSLNMYMARALFEQSWADRPTLCCKLLLTVLLCNTAKIRPLKLRILLLQISLWILDSQIPQSVFPPWNQRVVLSVVSSNFAQRGTLLVSHTSLFLFSALLQEIFPRCMKLLALQESPSAGGMSALELPPCLGSLFFSWSQWYLSSDDYTVSPHQITADTAAP